MLVRVIDQDGQVLLQVPIRLQGVPREKEALARSRQRGCAQIHSSGRALTVVSNPSASTGTRADGTNDAEVNPGYPSVWVLPGAVLVPESRIAGGVLVHTEGESARPSALGPHNPDSGGSPSRSHCEA